jgi:hypothetical protein
MKTNRYIAKIDVLRDYNPVAGIVASDMGRYLRKKGIIPRSEILKSVVFEDIPEKKVIIFTLSV